VLIRSIAITALLPLPALAGISHHVLPTPLRLTQDTTLDLNADGIADVGFWHLVDTFSDPHAYTQYVHNASGRPNACASPRPALGELVGPASTFTDIVRLARSEHRHVNGAADGPVEWAHWTPDSPTHLNPIGYAGLRATTANGDIHYGWIRYRLVSGYQFPLSGPSRYEVDLLEYAWETTPNTAIRVGATAPCGTSDFDFDGDSGTDADIEAFFACIAGNCCSNCWGADFNSDGDTGTDADIEAFFRVLAGGTC
jgi:hypothetical protein